MTGRLTESAPARRIAGVFRCGHPRAEGNLHLTGGGRVGCGTCRNARRREAEARKRATMSAADRVRAESERAMRDARRAWSLSIPDPETFARECPLVVAEALGSAWFVNNNSWRVNLQVAEILRPLGLCGCGNGDDGRSLTAFGIKVRRFVVEMDG